MATPANRKPAANPRRKRDEADYSPTPSEMLRRFVLCLRGFHFHREKPKATDWLVVALTLAVAGAAFYSAWIFQDEARKATRVSVRPWVGFDEGAIIQSTPLQIDASGNASLAYQFKLKTYSPTPASNVWGLGRLVVADDLNTVYEEPEPGLF